MLDLRRLYPFATALWRIVLALVALNLLLVVLLGPAPATLRRLESLNLEERARIAARVRAVEQMRSGGGPPRQDELALLIGFSTAREGIDAKLVEQAALAHTRLLNIASSGGSFFELDWYFGDVLKGKLQPQTLILGVHPCWLSGRMFGKPADDTPGPTGWVLDNRTRMHALMNAGLYAVRDGFHRWMGYVPTVADPWQTALLYAGQRASEGVLANQLVQWQRFGWFDPAQYDADSDDSAYFARLLDKASRSGAQLAVVLMPESQELRSRVPPEALAALLQVMSRVAPGVPVFDLRDSLPEMAFFDHAHVNAEGRARLSKALGELIAGLSSGNN